MLKDMNSRKTFKYAINITGKEPFSYCLLPSSMWFSIYVDTRSCHVTPLRGVWCSSFLLLVHISAPSCSNVSLDVILSCLFLAAGSRVLPLIGGSGHPPFRAATALKVSEWLRQIVVVTAFQRRVGRSRPRKVATTAAMATKGRSWSTRADSWRLSMAPEVSDENEGDDDDDNARGKASAETTTAVAPAEVVTTTATLSISCRRASNNRPIIMW